MNKVVEKEIKAWCTKAQLERAQKGATRRGAAVE
jgi:hypothetical protein